ncbi:MAG: carbonate dehydratase [Pseudomonadales bacterium]|nr:carbonate dehydratase [Pseudomonadales bacterium]
MLRKNPRGDWPQVHSSAFIDPTAILCGQVIIGENVFIGPYAVIRADEVNEHGEMEPIVIGAHSNIQDGVVIHSKAGGLVVIGEYTSIAHRSIIHGPCTIGSHVFIGFNSVVYNATIHDEVVVRHNCVIDSREILAGLYVPSCQKVNHETDTRLLKPASEYAHDFSESVAKANHSLVQGYRAIRNEF